MTTPRRPARRRGLGEGESVEEALKEFGDSEKVAEGIWRANRRRMRLRAIVKWAVRLMLVPAASCACWMRNGSNCGSRAADHPAKRCRNVMACCSASWRPPLRGFTRTRWHRLCGAVLIGLFCLSYRAIRQRANDAGIEVPDREFFNPFRGGLAGLILVFLCAYLIGQFVRMRRQAGAHFRRTFVRSLVPILASALLLAGGVSHAYLRWSEARLVVHLQQPGQRLCLDEMEMTGYAEYRDFLRGRNAARPCPSVSVSRGHR